MTQDRHEEKRRKHMAVMDDKKSNKTMTASIIYVRTEPDTTHAGTWCDVADGGIPYVPQAAIDRIEDLNAKLDKAVDVLREILFTSNEDHAGNWLDALARGQALMAECSFTKDESE